MHSPVFVGPGRKPRRPVFSQRGTHSSDLFVCLFHHASSQSKQNLIQLTFLLSKLLNTVSPYVWIWRLYVHAFNLLPFQSRDTYFSYLFFLVLINQHIFSHYVNFDWIPHFLGWYLPTQSNFAIVIGHWLSRSRQLGAMPNTFLLRASIVIIWVELINCSYLFDICTSSVHSSYEANIKALISWGTISLVGRVQDLRDRISPWVRCSVLKQDTSSSLLSICSTQKNVSTGT